MNRHSEAREFTRRSLLTGVLIGAVLTPLDEDALRAAAARPHADQHDKLPWEIEDQ